VLAFLSPSNWDSGAEVPLLIRLAGGYQPDVAFVAAGENASLSDLQTFSDNNQLNFPVWADPGGSELARRHFSAVPAFQFLDRGGRVVSSHQGFMAKGELLSAIAQITQ